MTILDNVSARLYQINSLISTDKGIQFTLQNRLEDIEITEIKKVVVSTQEVPLSSIQLNLDASTASETNIPVFLPLGTTMNIVCEFDDIEEGTQSIELHINTKELGIITLQVEDYLKANKTKALRVPRNSKRDYDADVIQKRHQFIASQTGTTLHHINQYSFDPNQVKGNCEFFIGVAQVPIGLAGPIHVKGEHAQGEFFIPLATAEGTLIASYNRGMKLINESGGVTCTIQEDLMQRAPVFVFHSARAARDFQIWVSNNEQEIAAIAEATTSVGKLAYIDVYLASKMAYLRFNFTTGDAAGQNMVSKATFTACNWIGDQYKEHKIEHFYLESNMATDKKSSQINILKTRGKRVTAECTIPKAKLERIMRVNPKTVAYHSQVANVGAMMSGVNNNGLHAANGIAAMFIATGQDAANVSESSAGIIHAETTPNGDLYMSITLPSLILATYGGGTSLPTQREALEIMDCYGAGKVHKLTEIMAGVVLAGELSLVSAISSSDWVSSHEKYGRNR